MGAEISFTCQTYIVTKIQGELREEQFDEFPRKHYTAEVILGS